MGGDATGPLAGLKIIEIAGVGPGPFCGMLLADMGADILRVERAAGATAGVDIPFDPKKDFLARGRRSVAVDLKAPAAAEFLLALVAQADALFEGFRPGVMERLGLGPEPCLACNPKLVYGRMTGWGQTGPLAQRAGHDVNFIGLSGALYVIGRRGEKPVIPSNLVGDFGGGGMVLAFGMLAAILSARSTGQGQVVDASMVEGSSLLMAMHHSLREMGIVSDARGTNSGDGGAHFYDVYETADGKFMAVGAAERNFYRQFIAAAGLDPERFADQMNRQDWPTLQAEVARVFKTRTQAQWCEIFDGLDACVSPVLSPGEAPLHPHNQARESFVEVAGLLQPAPAPRFSRTPSRVQRPPPTPGEGQAEVLADWGIASARIEAARQAGVLPPVAGAPGA